MNSILITGAVRDVVDFFKTVDSVLRLRAEGLADAVILSTWFGELDRHEGLAARLVKAGVDVVESEPPHTDIGPRPFWLYCIQGTSLARGLEGISAGSPTLKLRTDKTARLIDEFRPWLEASPPASGADQALEPVFERKLLTRQMRTSAPFHVSDMAFMGLKEDLQKVFTLDARLEAQVVKLSMGLELRWLIPPFYDLYPLLSSFYGRVHAFSLAGAVQEWGRRRDGTPLASPLLRLYALYFRCLAQNFHCVEERGSESAIAFEDCFDPGADKIIYTTMSSRGVTCSFRSQAVITALAEGRVASSANAERYLEALQWPRDRLAAALTEEEASDIAAFAARYNGGGSVVRPVLRRRAGEQSETTPDFGVRAAFAYLIEETNAPPADRPNLLAILAEEGGGEPAGAAYFAAAEAYRTGARGLAQSKKWALDWYARAAALRHKGAQLAYAKLIFANAQAEETQRAEARKWLEDAAARDKKAKAYLDSLAQSGR